MSTIRERVNGKAKWLAFGLSAGIPLILACIAFGEMKNELRSMQTAFATLNGNVVDLVKTVGDNTGRITALETRASLDEDFQKTEHTRFDNTIERIRK